jgi:hypothetical protein
MSFEHTDRQASDAQFEREVGWMDGLQSEHLRDVTDEVGSRTPARAIIRCNETSATPV